MSRFKDCLESDFNTFFNPDEFGEMYKINNKDMLIVIDGEQMLNRNSKIIDNINKSSILFYVKAVEFGELPSEGSPLIFDGKMMKIDSAKEDSGVYEIMLKQSRR